MSFPYVAFAGPLAGPFVRSLIADQIGGPRGFRPDKAQKGRHAERGAARQDVMDDTASQGAAPAGGPLEVFQAFLALGLTAFGGPTAHIGYFRRAFVERRGWLSEAAFADLL